MAPSSKNAAVAKDRRKSGNTAAASAAAPGKPTLVVTLKVPPQKLRAISDPDFVMDDTPANLSPSASGVPAATNGSSAENASDSTPDTPAAGTPAPPSSVMGPPTEGPKKKGVKRNAAAAANGNGEQKVRGKPGPKKKQRL